MMDITTALNLTIELWRRLIKDFDRLRGPHRYLRQAKEDVLHDLGHPNLINSCPTCEYVEHYANIRVLCDKNCLEQCPLGDLWWTDKELNKACEEDGTPYALANENWVVENKNGFAKQAQRIINESKRMLTEDF